MKSLTDDRSVNIDTLFSNFFSVADFQREYVWSDDDVSALLNDIWKGYQDNPQEQYFIGSIVLVSDKGNSYEIIDGQQRLTTLFLALCAFKVVAAASGANKDLLALIDNKLSSGNLKNGVVTQEIRISLTTPQSQAIVVAAYADKIGEAFTPDESSTRLKEAFDVSRGFFAQRIASPGQAGSFLEFVFSNIRLLPYVANSRRQALTVFETLNSRGVGLTPIDLVKNILFEKISSERWEALQDAWKGFIEVLEQTKEDAKRFLRYFILVEYGESVPEEEVYDWLKKNTKIAGIEPDAFHFLRRLTDFAISYKNIVDSKTANGTPLASIANVRKLAGRARQYYPFLVSLKPIGDKYIDKYARACESVLVAFGVQRMYTGDIEKIFTTWTIQARVCNNHAELDKVYADVIAPDLIKVGAGAIEKMKVLDEQGITKQKLKYLLCRLDAHLQALVNHETPYLEISKYRQFDVEHIRPNSGKGDASKTARLGNLTILENSLNRAIKDRKYETKKVDGYQKSQFILTMGIAVAPKGKNKHAKALMKVRQYEVWNDASIQDRQNNLAILAAEAFQWQASAAP